MLDLICRRYPGRLPSQYLEIDDEFTAIQVDYAIAKKHLFDDYKYDSEKMDGLQAMLKPLGQALGIEYKEQTKKTNPAGVPEEPLDVDDALAIYGAGKGTVVNHGKQE